MAPRCLLAPDDMFHLVSQIVQAFDFLRQLASKHVNSEEGALPVAFFLEQLAVPGADHGVFVPYFLAPDEDALLKELGVLVSQAEPALHVASRDLIALLPHIELPSLPHLMVPRPGPVWSDVFDSHVLAARDHEDGGEHLANQPARL